VENITLFEDDYTKNGITIICIDIESDRNFGIVRHVFGISIWDIWVVEIEFLPKRESGRYGEHYSRIKMMISRMPL